MNTRAIRRAFLALVLSGTASACGGPVTELEGAVGDIPIFAPATLVDQSRAHTSDDIGDPMKFSSFRWTLETERSPADVEAFYAARWPDAGRVEDEEENTVYLRNPPLPEGDEPLGESVGVTIHRTRVGGKTRFVLDEDVFAAKRRH